MLRPCAGTGKGSGDLFIFSLLCDPAKIVTALTIVEVENARKLERGRILLYWQEFLQENLHRVFDLLWSERGRLSSGYLVCG